MSIRPHAFVAMPFGSKPGPDGQLIDFNRVYTEYIAPAIEAAGLSAFRADQEQHAGDIRSDMFQELLIADLVVADLSIDNPNVWYELGVRHALRARGVVLVMGGRSTTAFDVYTDRKLRYGLKDGAPDPATLAGDIVKLSQMIQATMQSWTGRKISPVYSLLPYLQEPDWKSVRVACAQEFWVQHEEWEGRIDLARKQGLIGDLLVLADEAPVAAFRAEAWIKAGIALRKAERFRFALEQLELGLAIEPKNLAGLREKGICLQRLAQAQHEGHSLAQARAHYQTVLKDFPADAETLALLGRVDKDAWTESWLRAELTPEQRREEAGEQAALLRAAIDSYAQAYRRHPGHYFSGINALSLMHLHEHLCADQRYAAQLPALQGAVQFAASNEPVAAQAFWAQVTLADVELLQGSSVERVRAAYREAVAKADGDGFALKSSRAQLQLLAELGFRPEPVAAALAVFDKALAKLQAPAGPWQPRKVILFSGHMVDEPGRVEPRFPADKQAVVAQAIAASLDEMGAGPEDLALCQASAGSDLLFLQAAQARGLRCQILLPFGEAEFIQRSIDSRSSNSAAWRDLYYQVVQGLRPDRPLRLMPDALGPLPKGVNAYERCNLWLLYSAMSWGLAKLNLLTFWNGGGGDGPGGTAHMVQEVRRHTGRVSWIDPRKLW
ncbi:tetratricopeptide repeat-containing protein [Paucibacter sp. AS339]|uniref:tetratricopeptide repeat-containing protein n=1 Tax=Paucibacter hankyongi TaxID=3133434 RepID=UPI0030AF8E0B